MFRESAEFEAVCKNMFALRDRQDFHFVVFETKIEAICAPTSPQKRTGR